VKKSENTNLSSKFQFDLETVDEEPPRGNATANSLLLLFLLYYYYYYTAYKISKIHELLKKIAMPF